MGEDGTLKKASTGSDSTGMIRAKTGSLTGVAASFGTYEGKKRKTIFFAFAVNNYPSKTFKPMWDFRDRIISELWEKY
jgi:D-alanyl-D-alanine carboxypeptidase